MSRPVYDRIGHGYADVRKPNPRLAAVIADVLGDARTILNVGAGTGAYEPDDRFVVAVEPSMVMIRQRARGPAVRAVAEALPFDDGAFDAAMATSTVHHWTDRVAGLREMRRAAARVVIATWLPGAGEPFWLDTDYFPEEADRMSASYPTAAELEDALGPIDVHVVPVPWDCEDGGDAYWRRPERYLDERVWRSLSGFALLDPAERERGLAKLEADLVSGAWRERHAHLLEREELDLGYRLVVTR